MQKKLQKLGDIYTQKHHKKKQVRDANLATKQSKGQDSVAEPSRAKEPSRHHRHSSKAKENEKEDYIARCTDCNQNKADRYKPYGTLKTPRILTRAWKSIT